MSVADITRQDPVTLSPTDTVERAAQVLVQERALALPVVEASGKLVGTFGVDDLAKLLLPRAVTLDVGLEELTDLDFVVDSLEELRERMDRVCEQPVRRYMDTETRRPLDPDSSFTEALFLLHRLGEDLPVVDPSTGKLVGMVSPWDVLSRLG
ncbi:MAG: CBS domain-containing protein [Candidatus Palauibacterales bacterium]|nr:CBS domain-containing protein [Candidatus Palauibacterales bacterium]